MYHSSGPNTESNPGGGRIQKKTSRRLNISSKSYQIRSECEALGFQVSFQNSRVENGTDHVFGISTADLVTFIVQQRSGPVTNYPCSNIEIPAEKIDQRFFSVVPSSKKTSFSATFLVCISIIITQLHCELIGFPERT